MFEDDIREKTERGLDLLRIQAAGDMWPDDMVVDRQIEVIHEEVLTRLRRIVILDGGLRTPRQAEILIATGLPIVAFTIALPPAECKLRILAKPRMGRDGKPRPDDTPHGVDKRHLVYEKETAQVPAVLQVRGVNHYNINGWKNAAAKASEIADILRIPRVESEDEGHRVARTWRPPNLSFQSHVSQAVVAQ
jgi:adenylate kinase family enzyme